MSSTVETYRRIAASVLAVLAIGPLSAIVWGGPGTASAADDRPLKSSYRLLDRVQSQLRVAEKSPNPRKQRANVLLAADSLDVFVESIFQDPSGGRKPTGQSLLGCGAGASWKIARILAVLDANLELGGARSSLRARALEGGLRGAHFLEQYLAGCRGADDARAIATDILRIAKSLLEEHAGGRLDEEELLAGTQEVAGFKQTMLADERIYSCDVLPIYLRVKEIYTEIGLAYFAESTADRKVSIRAALRSAKSLIRLWTQAPCGGKCADGEDNDGDGLRDKRDPGCQTGVGGAYEPQDESEEHYDPEFDCTRLETGKTVSSFIRQPNSGSTMSRHSLQNFTDGRVIVERASKEADFSSGGPIPVGTGVCGPGTSATVEWTRADLVMHWVMKVTKEDAGVVPPAKQIIVAADTR